MKSIAIVKKTINDTSVVLGFPINGIQIVKGNRSSIDVIIDEFGTDILLYKQSNMTVYDNTENTIDANWQDVCDLELLGVSTSMWCGGAEYIIYRKNDKLKKEIKIEDKKIHIKHSLGWCKKCGTYCFGDCEAN